MVPLRVFLLIVLAFVSVHSTAHAAYTVKDLLAGKTRPDRPGESFSLVYTPVIDGDRVVFLTGGGWTPDGLWSLSLTTGKVTKLAGIGTAVPGSTATFSCFCLAYAVDDATPRARDGTVAFFAMDTAGRSGLYTVPIKGGSLRRIASTIVPSADGSRYKRFGQGAALSRTTVYFYAETEAGHRGIHAVSLDGTGRRLVIDERTTLAARTPTGPVANYYSGYTRFTAGPTRVYFSATGLFDPVSGPNAVFTEGRSIVVDNMTVLPGGSRAHARIGPFSAPPGTGPIAYLADEPSTGYAGVFRAAPGKTATVITSTRRNAPVIAKPFQAFTRLCAGDDAVAFSALADGRTGIFITPKGSVTTAVAVEGVGGLYKLALADGCLSGRRVVFREDGGANRLLLGTPR